MMGKMKKLQQAQKMLKNPRESARIRAIAGIITGLERDQRAAVQDLAEAVDGAEVPADLPDGETRLHRLCDAIPALLSGGPFAVYLQQDAPDEFDPEAAAEYVGMDPDEFAEQVETWADAYRQRVDGDHADRELADAHTRNTFGMDLERFEEEVVGFDPADYLRRFIAGPMEEHTAAIEAIAEAAEADE